MNSFYEKYENKVAEVEKVRTQIEGFVKECFKGCGHVSVSKDEIEIQLDSHTYFTLKTLEQLSKELSDKELTFKICNNINRGVFGHYNYLSLKVLERDDDD